MRRDVWASGRRGRVISLQTVWMSRDLKENDSGLWAFKQKIILSILQHCPSLGSTVLSEALPSSKCCGTCQEMMPYGVSVFLRPGSIRTSLTSQFTEVSVMTFIITFFKQQNFPIHLGYMPMLQVWVISSWKNVFSSHSLLLCLNLFMTCWVWIDTAFASLTPSPSDVSLMLSWLL